MENKTDMSFGRQSVAPSDLKRFFADVDRLTLSKPQSTSENINHSEMEVFLNEFNRRLLKAEERQQKYDVVHASHFNYFHLLAPDENKLSEILAFLLEPRERHGQGPVFLELLLAQLQLVVPGARLQSATVYCEAPTYL